MTLPTEDVAALVARLKHPFRADLAALCDDAATALSTLAGERDEARMAVLSMIFMPGVRAALDGLPADDPTAPYIACVKSLKAAEAELASLREKVKADVADAYEDAARAGWNACRKSIYAVCEDVMGENDKHREDTGNPPRHHFGRGGMAAAKSIARGFNSMEAEDDENLAQAIAACRAALDPAHD